MPSWLPLLLLLTACPLMMFFMMRGMGGSHKTNADHEDEHPNGIAPGNTEARDERLAQLESEVAALRASRDHNDVGPP